MSLLPAWLLGPHSQADSGLFPTIIPIPHVVQTPLIGVPAIRPLTPDQEATAEAMLTTLLAEQMPLVPTRPILVELTGEGYRVIAGIDNFEAQRASGASLILTYETGSDYAYALMCDLDRIYERLDEGRMTIVERAECLAEHERILALLYPEVEYETAQLRLGGA